MIRRKSTFPWARPHAKYDLIYDFIYEVGTILPHFFSWKTLRLTQSKKLSQNPTAGNQIQLQVEDTCPKPLCLSAQAVGAIPGWWCDVAIRALSTSAYSFSYH